jgi:hypothetical protein
LSDGYDISEQLQLSQYDGSFVGHPMCFCPPRYINMTCPIPCLQAQLNYRYIWNNSTGVGLILSTVVPVNNCTDGNCTRPPTPPPFLPHCPKVQTYAQGLSIDHVPWTTCIGLYPAPIHPWCLLCLGPFSLLGMNLIPLNRFTLNSSLILIGALDPKYGMAPPSATPLLNINLKCTPPWICSSVL